MPLTGTAPASPRKTEGTVPSAPRRRGRPDGGAGEDGWVGLVIVVAWPASFAANWAARASAQVSSRRTRPWLPRPWPSGRRGAEDDPD
jgi:hypothetical protein